MSYSSGAMANHQVIGSSDEDSTKKASTGRQPVGKRTRKPTKKLQENKDDEIQKMKRKLARLEKQNKRLKKGKGTRHSGVEEHASDDRDEDSEDADEEEYESEEQDEETGQGTNYGSAFRSTGIVNGAADTTTEGPRERLRREGSARPPASAAPDGNESLENPSGDVTTGAVTAAVPQAANVALQYSENLSSTSTQCASAPAQREKRLRTTGTSGGRTGSASTDEDGTDSGPRKKRLRYRNDQVPTGSAKAQDYEPHIRRLILQAIRDFESRVVTEDPFPTPELQTHWAIAAWSAVQSGQPADDQYELPDRVITLITDRTSRIRGALRDKIRPSIASAYGFIQDGTHDATRNNYLKYQRLMNVDPDTKRPDPIFHYRDVETQAGFARNPVIFQAIRDAWFPSNGQKLGTQFRSRFEPISLASLALIFTVIHYCIDQWADGAYNPELEFTEHAYGTTYKTYLSKLSEWESIDVSKVQKIRKKLHDRARRAIGEPVETPEGVHGLRPDVRERAKAELQAERDSDSDADLGGAS
ncbi:hypothetical protein OH77DRAFT_1422089 [Trametes cingulata]|nr:hypothetical protein OH77DRAFT_1422089 [Trametes cingulata]